MNPTLDRMAKLDHRVFDPPSRSTPPRSSISQASLSQSMGKPPIGLPLAQQPSSSQLMTQATPSQLTQPLPLVVDPPAVGDYFRISGIDGDDLRSDSDSESPPPKSGEKKKRKRKLTNSSSSNGQTPLITTTAPTNSNSGTGKRAGRFTKEEDRLIRSGVKKFGEDWQKVLHYTKIQRSPASIHKRYEKIGDKSCSNDDLPLSSAASPLSLSSPALEHSFSPSSPFSPPQSFEGTSSPPASPSPTSSAPIPIPDSPHSPSPHTPSPPHSPSPPHATGGGDLPSYPIFEKQPSSHLHQSKLSFKEDNFETPKGRSTRQRKRSRSGENHSLSNDADPYPPQQQPQQQRPAEKRRKVEKEEVHEESAIQGGEDLESSTSSSSMVAMSPLTNSMMINNSAWGRAIKEAHRQVLVNMCRIQRKELRDRLERESLLLGRNTLERAMHGYNDVWIEGARYREIYQSEELLKKKKEELDQERKKVMKERASRRGVNLSEDARRREAIQDEIYRLNTQNLKDEENELEKERQKYENDKSIHIKSLKIVLMEDGSRFRNNPLFKDGRYLLLELLGKGGFSEVYKAFDFHRVEYVACKIHQINSNWSDEKKKNYSRKTMREYHIHKDLHHPKVVRLLDVFEIDISSFCTVLEYCEDQDLDGLLKKKSLKEREVKTIMVQILEGLEYLNQQKNPIIHYDLKPGNILFQNGEAKITDFGLSKMVDVDCESTDYTSHGAGTYWYLPPECFDASTKTISPKVDVWSVGVLTYQMLYGMKPFGHNMSQQAILVNNVIRNAKSVSFPTKPAVSEDAKSFVKSCLKYYPRDRMSVDQCLKHPFLNLLKGKKRSSSSASSSSS